VDLDAWRTFLGRSAAGLQRRLRGDLRLVACGLFRTAGGCVLWLDCVDAGAAVGWRGRARLGVPPDAAEDDPLVRRRLRLALAEALADIAVRSGTGVALWRGEGARRAGSRPARASSQAGG